MIMKTIVHIDKCRVFSRDEDYRNFSVVRVNNDVLKSLGGRGAWIAIEPAEQPVFRRVYGAGPTGLAKSEIELDYDTRLELNVEINRDDKGYYPCKLDLRQATTFEVLLAHWNHPSPNYSMPLKLSLISVVLGLLGLVLAILSVVSTT